MIETNIEKSNVLHLSSESSRKLADISPSGILHLNRKMHITYKNPALKRMMNETDEDSLQFIGKSIFDLTSIKAAGLIDLFNRIANAEIITDYQTEFTSIYEKTVYISIHSIPLFDSLGAFDGAIITVSDKTNEKNVRQALEESENKLKSIFNSTDEAFFIFDFETNSIEEVNEAFYRLYEYSKEDLELISIDDLCAIEEGYDAKKAEHLTDKLSFKESVEFEWKAKSKTGKLLNVEVSVKKIEICHKVKALAIVRDISEKKKIQTDLIESQAKYKALFELTGDAILILKDSRIVDCNDTSLSLFNCAKEHILGKTPMDLSPEYQEDGTKTQEIGDKLIELAMNHKSQRFEWLHKDFNDNLFFVDITLNKFFINNNCYLLAMLRDISERKIYQEKLLYENRLMDSMLNSLPAMFFMYSQDGKLKKWNKNKEIFTGFSKDELKDKSILDWFEGYALEQVVEGLPGLFETTEIQTNILNTKIKDGSIVPYLYTTSTFEGNNQKYLIGTGIDVSEWKYIEDAYIESEEKYKNLIENANIGILIIEEGIVKLANPFMEEIIGYTPSEVLNRDFFDYIHEEDNEKLRKKFEELKIQKNITNPENIVFRIYSRNNNIKWIESRSVQIFWAGKDSILCFLTNISKRVETEEKIKDSENSLRTYLDTLPDPAFLIDTEMKIIVCNQSLADLYDEYLPNLIGKDVLSYLDEPLRSIRYGYIQACINSKNPIQIEDEREGIFSVTHYYPVKDKFGKVTRVAIISNDITERKLIEKQLETSEERYRNLFENANEAIVVIKNNRIVLYNKKSTDIIMGRLPQFLDNEFSKFIHPDDKDFIIETHNQILLGSKNDKKYRFRVILDEYLFVWLEASTVLINFEGEPATLSFINDITKQIEAENMIHIQNMAMESAVFAICLADLKGNITYYNKAFLELWELDENTEIIGKQFLDCMFINNYKHILEKLRINGYSIGEEKAVLNNNSEKWVRYSINKVDDKNGRPVQLIASFVDISQRKSFEQSLNQLNLELEEKVITRTSELNETLHKLENTNIELQTLNDELNERSNNLILLNEKLSESKLELKAANATKDKFISILAHDLKNPLQSIIITSELITKYSSAFDNEKIIEKVTQIFNTSHKINDLLNNLLTWFKSQSGRIEFRPQVVNILDIISNSYVLFESMIFEKQLNFVNHIKEEISLFGDKLMLDTIFRNLLSNAIKFTPNNGSIEIDFHNDIDYYHFKIKDSGIGLSEEDLEKLFRLDVSYSTIGNSKEKGTGLGLLLCKEFIDKHNGLIKAESKLGEGTEFIISLLK